MILRCLYYSCLLLCAVLALVNRKSLKSRRLDIFVPYLWLVFIQESLALTYNLLYPKGSTSIIYNLFYWPVSATVFAFFFYRIPFNAPVRKLILGMQVLYLSLTIITFVFLHPIHVYNSYLSIASSLLITCYGILFLFSYFNLDSLAEQKKWSPVVWIIIGIVVFYPVANISLSLYKYILTYKATIFGTMLYNTIPRVTSIAMYSCFAYAFYLCKKKD